MFDRKSVSISYFDRASGTVRTETVMGDKALRFAYENALGRSLWGILFGGKLLSSLMGRFYDSGFSKKAIATLANLPGCMPQEAEKTPEEYRCFNEFFTRRLKPGSRPFDPSPDVLVSPCDGRLLVYPAIAPSSAVPVKGAKRTINELCRAELPEAELAVAVFRLAPVDYHRYHFPCDCFQAAPATVVKGKYHSVNPIALKRRPDLYVENTRQITLLHSDVFGDFRMVDVGAFGVGTICQTAIAGAHAKMAEKGFFQFGGSTVVLVLDAKKIRFDADLLAASEKGMELLIRCGERLGEARRVENAKAEQK